MFHWYVRVPGAAYALSFWLDDDTEGSAMAEYCEWAKIDHFPDDGECWPA